MTPAAEVTVIGKKAQLSKVLNELGYRNSLLRCALGFSLALLLSFHQSRHLLPVYINAPSHCLISLTSLLFLQNPG